MTLPEYVLNIICDNKSLRLVLEAEGGAGKTCSLLETVKALVQCENVIPLYVKCSGMTNCDIVTHLAMEYSAVMGLPSSGTDLIGGFKHLLIESANTGKKCLILLDGLNESPSIKELCDHILDPNMREVSFIVSTRPLEKRRREQFSHAGFEFVKTCPLGLSGASIDTAAINPELKALLESPFFLKRYIQIEDRFDADQSRGTTTRYSLLDQYLNWSMEKQPTKDNDEEAFNREALNVFSKVCFGLQASNRFRVTERDARELSSPIEYQNALSLWKRLGYVTDNNENISHQIDRDFFAARYVVTQIDEAVENKDYETVSSLFTKRHTRDVCAFVAEAFASDTAKLHNALKNICHARKDRTDTAFYRNLVAVFSATGNKSELLTMDGFDFQDADLIDTDFSAIDVFSNCDFTGTNLPIGVLPRKSIPYAKPQNGVDLGNGCLAFWGASKGFKYIDTFVNMETGETRDKLYEYSETLNIIPFNDQNHAGCYLRILRWRHSLLEEYRHDAVICRPLKYNPKEDKLVFEKGGSFKIDSRSIAWDIVSDSASTGFLFSRSSSEILHYDLDSLQLISVDDPEQYFTALGYLSAKKKYDLFRYSRWVKIVSLPDGSTFAIGTKVFGHNAPVSLEEYNQSFVNHCNPDIDPPEDVREWDPTDYNIVFEPSSNTLTPICSSYVYDICASPFGLVYADTDGLKLYRNGETVSLTLPVEFTNEPISRLYSYHEHVVFDNSENVCGVRLSIGENDEIITEVEFVLSRIVLCPVRGSVFSMLSSGANFESCWAVDPSAGSLHLLTYGNRHIEEPLYNPETKEAVLIRPSFETKLHNNAVYRPAIIRFGTDLKIVYQDIKEYTSSGPSVLYNGSIYSARPKEENASSCLWQAFHGVIIDGNIENKKLFAVENCNTLYPYVEPAGGVSYIYFQGSRVYRVTENSTMPSRQRFTHELLYDFGPCVNENHDISDVCISNVISAPNGDLAITLNQFEDQKDFNRVLFLHKGKPYDISVYLDFLRNEGVYLLKDFFFLPVKTRNSIRIFLCFRRSRAWLEIYEIVIKKEKETPVLSKESFNMRNNPVGAFSLGDNKVYFYSENGSCMCIADRKNEKTFPLVSTHSFPASKFSLDSLPPEMAESLKLYGAIVE